MKTRFITLAVLSLVCALLPSSAMALSGAPYIHDPATIMECDGKYYTYGTGGGGLISEDGWTWNSGAERPGGGLAPDAVKIGDRYYLSYAGQGGGMNGGHAGAINVMWSLSLDPQSPDFGFKDNNVVARTDGVEDCDAIDPGFFLDPVDGRLWVAYGTFFGYIRIVELDPATGRRIEGNEPVNIAIDCEAVSIMYHDGWYYLMGTHGTCCSGANSSYHIRAGRSRKVTGPYLDHTGMDMLRGGGKYFVGSHNRQIGAGHFGIINDGEGVQKFSCHYEADLDLSGRSTLAIQSMYWVDGWPVCGRDINKGGKFRIESARSGHVIEMGVDPVAVGSNRNTGGARGRGGMGGFGGGRRGATNTPPTPIADQTAEEVSGNWSKESVEARMSAYMLQAHQNWDITPVSDAGGYLGSPFFKITIADTDHALAATKDGELIVVPAFTGASEQLWRIDQLTDGNFRIVPKAEAKSKTPLAVTALGITTPTLDTFDNDSTYGKWKLIDVE